MSASKTETARRHEQAREALAASGTSRAGTQALNLQCHAAHHVAVVYRTSAGLVYAARTGPHGHGGRDFVDTGHHGAQAGSEYLDLVEAAGAADDLPAWCACGPLSIPRREILRWIREGRHTVRMS